MRNILLPFDTLCFFSLGYLLLFSVCLDAADVNSKNYRTRPSVHIELDGKHLQFDVGPNFIDQINRNRIEWIDAVIYTHCHADHVSGTNDLVMPSRKQQMDMPVYGPEQTIQILERNFNYMFSKDTFKGGGVAHLSRVGSGRGV